MDFDSYFFFSRQKGEGGLGGFKKKKSRILYCMLFLSSHARDSKNGAYFRRDKARHRSRLARHARQRVNVDVYVPLRSSPLFDGCVGGQGERARPGPPVVACSVRQAARQSCRGVIRCICMQVHPGGGGHQAR